MTKTELHRIEESLKEHGSKGPVIKCRLEYLPGKPVRIVNGHKREFLCKKFRISIEETVLIAKTQEDYLKYLRQFKEPPLTTKEKVTWANYYAEELYNSDVPKGQICKTVAELIEAPYKTVIRWLYDKYKDPVKREAGSCSQHESRKPLTLMPQPPEEYDFIDRQIWNASCKKLGQKLLLELVGSIKQHFESLRSKPTITASVSELAEVLYSKLEEQNFPKLDEDNLRWIKFLYEAYYVRQKDQ